MQVAVKCWGGKSFRRKVALPDGLFSAIAEYRAKKDKVLGTFEEFSSFGMIGDGGSAS